MPFLYILLGVAMLLLLVLFLPVYVHIRFDGELMVKVRVLGIPITLLPASPQEEKPPPTKKKPSKGKALGKELSDSFHRDGLTATLHYLGQLAAIAGKAVGRMLRAVTVDKLRLELLIATDDPADTAVRYGQVCSVLYPALAAVSGPVRIRRRQLRVEPNFLLSESSVYADIHLHIWVFRVAGAAIALLWRYMIFNTDIPTDHKEVTTNGK